MTELKKLEKLMKKLDSQIAKAGAIREARLLKKATVIEKRIQELRNRR